LEWVGGRGGKQSSVIGCAPFTLCHPSHTRLRSPTAFDSYNLQYLLFSLFSARWSEPAFVVTVQSPHRYIKTYDMSDLGLELIVREG
jgi:hypothetical protein